ncbi:MAG: glycosyltransferase family 39 protein [Verrucomicrobiales bacterium]|nr:glycosyltransferase family 39 protein [Verrucomicrobiales bacterium]
MAPPSFLHKSWPERFRDPHFWFLLGGVIFVTVALVILRKMEHPWEGLTAWRIREGRRWLPEDYGRVYAFWAGLGATLLIGLTVIASLWWWRPAHPASAGTQAVGHRLHRYHWIALGVILLLAAFVRGQHLDRFVLRDEQDTIRYHLHGFYEPVRGDDTGAIGFTEMGWADAAFGNRHGNNPVLMTVLSRASLEIWWQISGVARDHYSIVAIRLPGCLAALAGVLAVAWCVLAFAPGRVAVIAAAIVAIHPLHIDYSIQARGYAYVLLGVPLAVAGAVWALQRGRWRDWIALVLGCAISLYAYLGSVFLVAPLVVAVFGVLAARGWTARRQSRPAPDVTRDVIRLGVVGLIITSLYITFALPAVMCFRQVHEDLPRMYAMDWAWWLAFWTAFAGGRIFNIRTSETGELPPIDQAFRDLVPDYPLVWIGMVLALPIAVIGVVRLWRTAPPAVRVVLIAALLSPFIQTAVHHFITRIVLFAYYFIYWLPPLACVAALGCDAVIARLVRLRPLAAGGRGAVAAVSLVLMIGAYFSVGAGGNPYVGQRRPAPTEPTVHLRNTFQWLSYPEGRTLKHPADQPTPPEFPEHLIAPAKPPQ